MYFNPDKSRASEQTFGLRFELEIQYDSARPMGNVAVSSVGSVIKMYLIGLHKDIYPVIARSCRWLDEAIGKGDEFAPNNHLHISKLNWARAICEWLENGIDSSAYWEDARVYEEAAWRSEKRPWPRNEIVNHGLDDYMAFAFQAAVPDEGVEGYEVAIDMYEYWLGDTAPLLKSLLNPREYAYALCLHYARNLYDKNELIAAGRKMLQANLEENWLGAGQFIRAATWLKIVYWQDNQSLTPLATILKAYENMPHVEFPYFLSEPKSELDSLIVIHDIAGDFAVAKTQKAEHESRLISLGFVRDGLQLRRPIVDDADRQQLVLRLIDMDALFSDGHGWCPSELASLYVKQGIIKKSYKVITWRGPGDYQLNTVAAS